MGTVVGLKVTFYTRPGCCLCEAALRVLRLVEREYSLDLRIVDVSGDPRLEADYGGLLPVATCGGKEIFRYHTSERALRQFLDRATKR